MKLVTFNEVRAAFKAQGIPDSTTEQVLKWKRENPELRKAYVNKALELARTHSGQLGSKWIVEEIRRTHLKNSPKTRFKFSNDLTPYLARILVLKYPSLKDRFIFKSVQGFQEELVA